MSQVDRVNFSRLVPHSQPSDDDKYLKWCLCFSLQADASPQEDGARVDHGHGAASTRAIDPQRAAGPGELWVGAFNVSRRNLCSGLER